MGIQPLTSLSKLVMLRVRSVFQEKPMEGVKDVLFFISRNN